MEELEGEVVDYEFQQDNTLVYKSKFENGIFLSRFKHKFDAMAKTDP